MSATPEIHRREFLARAGAVGCGVGGLVLASAATGDGASAPRETEIDRYAEAVGTRFRLRATSGAECEIVLDRVVEQPAMAGAPAGRVPFTLTFRGPTGRVIPQDVYRLDHARLGRTELLLVPVGLPGDRAVLEAVFG
jgi:hypothetical protein